MDVPHAPYSTEDLAWVHHQGFGFHAEGCAEEILRLLEPVRDRGGVVLELGCGSGLLTRHLLDAGLQVIATDASPAMLGIARTVVGDAAEIRQLVLPDDPLPPADAVISVGHCLNYLADEASVWRGLQAIAGALRPGGILAIDPAGRSVTTSSPQVSSPSSASARPRATPVRRRHRVGGRRSRPARMRRTPPP
jgi:SAM-dependent methyltransferase